jgi:hypothetical protein
MAAVEEVSGFTNGRFVAAVSGSRREIGATLCEYFTGVFPCERV